MKLHVRERLRGLHPTRAFRRWRDEVVHRAAGLPHVRGLRERHRAHEGGRLRRLLEWGLELEIPLMARPFVPSDALVLELTELWDEEGLGCSWTLRSRGLPEGAAIASGTLHFHEDGFVVEGDVRVDLGSLEQLPPALAKSAGPALERGICRAIERGYVEVARTLA